MPTPSFKFALGLIAVSLLPRMAAADIVTGTVTPATAKAVVVDATGKTVAELKPGAYQLPLAPGPTRPGAWHRRSVNRNS